MRNLKPILYAGVVCGVLDITAACVHARVAFGVPPLRLLQGVAGALLGREAATAGGLATAVLGLAMHFTMAFAVTVIFYLLSRRYPALLGYAGPAGLLYGLMVFSVNNFATLPFLSWVRSLYLHTPVVFPGSMGWPQAVIHLLCVGLPIALVVRRFGPAGGCTT
jgi:uncharacterized membrane protein YagU involved in acid resistance